MPYTLGQAAKATGKSKPAILNAIKSGRLLATRDERKQWQIDPAELHRVYAPAVQVNETEHKETPLSRSEIAFLKQQNDYLKAQLATLEAVTADLRKDRDDLSRKLDAEAEECRNNAAEIRRLTLMITHQTAANQNMPQLPVVRSWLWLAVAVVVTGVAIAFYVLHMRQGGA
jgi:predicted RNase H-like nuclease (RuvC/YqgF family)